MLDPELSMKYLLRIMSVLAENNPITITNLAMLSRMNHKRRKEMTACLERVHLVRTETKSNRKYIALTIKGREYCNKLLDIGRINSAL